MGNGTCLVGNLHIGNMIRFVGDSSLTASDGRSFRMPVWVRHSWMVSRPLPGRYGDADKHGVLVRAVNHVARFGPTSLEPRCHYNWEENELWTPFLPE